MHTAAINIVDSEVDDMLGEECIMYDILLSPPDASVYPILKIGF